MTRALGGFEGQALTEGAVQMKAILELVFDAIVETDSRGVVTGWDSKAETVFGWTGPEIVGRLLGDVVVLPGFREAYQQEFNDLLADGDSPVASKRVETKMLHRDGRQLYVEVFIGGEQQSSVCAILHTFSNYGRQPAWSSSAH
jgi:PAS domain S-box-containing protein